MQSFHEHYDSECNYSGYNTIPTNLYMIEDRGTPPLQLFLIIIRRLISIQQNRVNYECRRQTMERIAIKHHPINLSDAQ